MSVKSSVRNLGHDKEEFVIENTISKHFGMLEDVLKQEIQEIEKLSPYKLNLIDNDLDNIEKLIDSFIIQGNQIKNYQQAIHFLKKYS